MEQQLENIFLSQKIAKKRYIYIILKMMKENFHASGARLGSALLQVFC